MICKNCGNDLSNDAEFCPKCGIDVDDHEVDMAINMVNFNVPKRAAHTPKHISTPEPELSLQTEQVQTSVVSKGPKHQKVTENKSRSKKINKRNVLKQEKKQKSKEKPKYYPYSKYTDSDRYIPASSFKTKAKEAAEEFGNIASVAADDFKDRVKFSLWKFREKYIRSMSTTAKRIWLVLLILAAIFIIGSMVLGVTKCVMDATKPQDEAPVSRNEMVPKNPHAKLHYRDSKTEKNSKDLLLKTDVRSTDWIAGSEKDALDEAWYLAGADVPFPDASEISKKLKLSSVPNLDTCAITIGSVNFSNLTQDKIKLDKYTNEAKAYIYLTESNQPVSQSYCAAFNSHKDGNSDNLTITKTGNGQESGALILAEAISENPYGPCPFMVIAFDVFDAKTIKSLDAAKDASHDASDASDSSVSSNSDISKKSPGNAKELDFKLDSIKFKVQFFVGSIVEYIGDKKQGFNAEWQIGKTW